MSPPHVALFPSAGMGHQTPFLRLAATLASRGCTVTLIAVKPTVSAAEATHMSTFFSTHPHINRLDFQILPYNNPTKPTTDDPFFIQFEAISRSVHLLKPLLSSSSPPLSTIFSDLTVAVSITPIADDLSIPNYLLITTSARFLSLMACLPFFISENSAKFSDKDVKIPGLDPLPLSTIPPPFFNPNHLFTSTLTSNARFLPRSKGILINTFDGFEPETIASFNSGRVLNHLPPLLPIGPFEPHNKLEKGHNLPWLDKQRFGSVVYVSFGSRTAMSKEQIRELGTGLERSGCAFLWVLKASKVDKEDNVELNHLLGDSFLERLNRKGKGIVVKEWVNQEEILKHPAIGGFLSHCGWNSVMEAALHGVPILGWPQHGDQKVNAGVVVSSGLGVWGRDWGWRGERLVEGEEIAEKVREMMRDGKLKIRAKEIGEEARKALDACGSSEKTLMAIVDSLIVAGNNI